MILKAVSPSLTNKQLAARDVSQLVFDLNKVKLSSQKLYKQLSHYCAENHILEELADRNWQDSVKLIHSLFRLDAEINNPQFFRVCSQILSRDLHERSKKELR